MLYVPGQMELVVHMFARGKHYDINTQYYMPPPPPPTCGPAGTIHSEVSLSEMEKKVGQSSH